jgi:hypothetical protein
MAKPKQLGRPRSQGSGPRELKYVKRAGDLPRPSCGLPVPCQRHGFGVGLGVAEAFADGLGLADGDGLALADGDGLALADGDGLALADGDGLALTKGVALAFGAADGAGDCDGEITAGLLPCR